jgi:hypothetical protein
VCCLRRLCAHLSCLLIPQLGQNKMKLIPGLTPRRYPEFGYKRLVKQPERIGLIHGAAAWKHYLMTAWGHERFKANRATHGSNVVASTTSTEPIVKCLPPGVPAIYMVSIYPMEILQVPGRVIMFFEYGNYVRQIFTDGRKHQSLTPTWMGDSIGKWEGDTLVDASGFNDKTWIDSEGHPHSDALHVVERIRRANSDHLDVR